ncbi:Hypothetical_protein [Hexamita inflata]|uniref:Hypothetical_protein n=1 Tax=Hexamita inflata TaxID=28002 RepID=A0AA86TIA8_9EUKA|nr:Hypothetical protein HINF_LOCUS7139 [Hexamita inflata]
MSIVDTILVISQDMVSVPVWMQNISIQSAMQYARMMNAMGETEDLDSQFTNKTRIIQTQNIKLLTVATEVDNVIFSQYLPCALTTATAHYELSDQQRLSPPQFILAAQTSTVYIILILDPQFLIEDIKYELIFSELQIMLDQSIFDISQSPQFARLRFNSNNQIIEQLIQQQSNQLVLDDVYNNSSFVHQCSKMFKKPNKLPIQSIKSINIFDQFIEKSTDEGYSEYRMPTALTRTASQIFQAKLQKNVYFASSIFDININRSCQEQFQNYIYANYPYKLKTGIKIENDNIQQFTKYFPLKPLQVQNELYFMLNKELYKLMMKYLVQKDTKIILFCSNIIGRIIVNTLHATLNFDYLLDPELPINCECITNGDKVINIANPKTAIQKQIILPFEEYLTKNPDIIQQTIAESNLVQCKCGRFSHKVHICDIKMQVINSNFSEYHITELCSDKYDVLCCDLETKEFYLIKRRYLQESNSQLFGDIQRQSQLDWVNTQEIKLKVTKWDVQQNGLAFFNKMLSIQNVFEENK